MENGEATHTDKKIDCSPKRLRWAWRRGSSAYHHFAPQFNGVLTGLMATKFGCYEFRLILMAVKFVKFLLVSGLRWRFWTLEILVMLNYRQLRLSRMRGSCSSETQLCSVAKHGADKIAHFQAGNVFMKFSLYSVVCCCLIDKSNGCLEFLLEPISSK